MRRGDLALSWALMGLIGVLKSILEDGGPASAARGEHPLRQAVREQMSGKTDDEQRLVTAIAGLLACVAYADHVFTEEEKTKVREELSRLHALDADGVNAIASLLERDIVSIVGHGDRAWVRDLRDLTDREGRIEVLDVLVDLAAADDELAHAEVNYLRRLATSLGLTQPEYNAVQARHRDKLATLG
jgi:uncharacterized tellurite resistance protein B-like protein